MDSSSLKFPKLKGSTNWDIWSLRASAALTQKGYIDVMRPSNNIPPLQPALQAVQGDIDQQAQIQQANSEAQNTYQVQYRAYEAYNAQRETQSYQAAALIRLLLEDGPLLQTRNINDALQLWNRLEALYEPKGFSSEFLTSRELFTTTLTRCNGSIEAYLTRIKRLTDELAARKLPIPSKVIAAYTLSNLGPEWENTVAIISQSYRTHEGPEIDLVALFGQLVDESRRRQARDPSDEMVMATQAKPSKAKCPHCKKGGHPPEKCWFKNLHLRSRKGNAVPQRRGEQLDNGTTKAYITEEEEIILHSTIPESIGTWYLDSAATSHISAYKDLF